MCRYGIKNLFSFENMLKMIIMVFILLYSMAPLNDPDMFFHIKNGEHIFYNWIPQFDPYSMHDNITFIQHEWLADIIFYLIYSIAGFKSLWWFKIIMDFVVFGLLYWLIYQNTAKNIRISFFIGGLLTIFLNTHIKIRPQIFSYIIFLLELHILETYDKSKSFKYLLTLPILGVFLINTHGALNPIFFSILAVYVLTSYYRLEYKKHYIKIQKIIENKFHTIKLIVMSLVSFAAMITNPNGLNALIYPYKVVGNSSLFQFISELKPLNIRTNFGLSMFIFFCIIIFTVIITRKQFTLRQFIFIFSFMSLTLYSIRFASYFLLIGGFFFAQYLDTIFTSDLLENNPACIKLFKSVNIIGYILFFTAFCISFVIKGLDIKVLSLDRYPEGAVPILQKAENLILYNEFDCGHFLIFNKIKVFIDGRAEMYTRKFNDVDVLDEYLKAYNGKIYEQNFIDNYKFNYFLVYKDMPMSVFLANSSEYEKLYEEKKYILFKRL